MKTILNKDKMREVKGGVSAQDLADWLWETTKIC